MTRRGFASWAAGDSRFVLVLGSWALKFPRLRALRRGLRQNRRERDAWRAGRSIGPYALCPILASGPGGIFIAMPRCHPLTAEAFAWVNDTDRILDYRDARPDLPIEIKVDSFGMLPSQGIVAVDYGGSSGRRDDR